MKSLKVIKPWIGSRFLFLALLLGFFLIALTNQVWILAILSGAFLIMVFKVFYYQYNYHEHGIEMKRLFFPDVLLDSKDIVFFEEGSLPLGTKFDFGPKAVLKSGRKINLPCGHSVDQKELLNFLGETYKKRIQYLRRI